MKISPIDDMLPIIDAIPFVAIPTNLFHIFARHKYKFVEATSAYGRYLKTRSSSLDHIIRAIPVLGFVAAIYEIVIKIFNYNQRANNWSFFVDLVRNKTKNKGELFSLHLAPVDLPKKVNELNLIFQHIPLKVIKTPLFWVNLIADEELPFGREIAYLEYLYNQMPAEMKTALFTQEHIALRLIQKKDSYDFLYLHNLFDAKNPKILEACFQKLLLVKEVDGDQLTYVISHFIAKNFVNLFNNKKLLKESFIKYPLLFTWFNRPNLEGFWSSENLRLLAGFALPFMRNIPRPTQETINLFYQTICDPRFLDEIEKKNPTFRAVRARAGNLGVAPNH